MSSAHIRHPRADLTPHGWITHTSIMLHWRAEHLSEMKKQNQDTSLIRSRAVATLHLFIISGQI